MSSIVVGITAGGRPEPALDFAIEEALQRNVSLKVVHAYAIQVYVETPGGDWPGSTQQLRADAHRRASRAVAAATHRLARGRHLQISLEVVQSDAVGALVLAAERADLLIVGSRGGGAVRRATRGSVSAGCLHHAEVPVAIIPTRTPSGDDHWLRSRVLVGFDGSPASVSALAWGVAQARRWECPLVPVVVCPSYGRVPTPMRRHDGEAQSPLRGALAAHLTDAGADGLSVEPRYVIGQPVQQLALLLGPHDLLVLGSRGHGALASLLLGSTSLPLAEGSACPVVVVRAATGEAEHLRPLTASLVS